MTISLKLIALPSLKLKIDISECPSCKGHAMKIIATEVQTYFAVKTKKLKFARKPFRIKLCRLIFLYANTSNRAVRDFRQAFNKIPYCPNKSI